MLVSNSENHKQNCEFAEESIAFLYGESDEMQKVQFSRHLENCSSCAEEINAYSSIHTSIQNWKMKKFDVLDTPTIEIPTDSRQSDKEIAVSSSWLFNLRRTFSLQRGLVQVGAFAALLICLSFGLYFLSSDNQENNIVEKTDNKNSEVVLPNFDNDVAKIDKSDSQNNSNSQASNTGKSVDLPPLPPVIEENSPASQTVPVKISTSQKNSADSRKSSDRKTPKVHRKTSPINNRSVPKLNALPEEADDEDLRLADLFDEIDAR